ncbi:MAG: bifunctional 3-demethylubiquinol 3-O-methyltransferase/2-polyprenyl-6-hydroxyphenol methylase, partial [Pseudomonadota bacterium]
MLRKDILTSDKAQASTADNAEIERFNALAEEWWKPNGKFKVVHAFNATRVGWLSTHVPAAFDRAAMTT